MDDLFHVCDVKWTSPVTWLFVEQFVHGNMKEKWVIKF